MNDSAAQVKSVFSNRNFRLVFLGALLSDLGSVLYSFVVSFYILELSGNNAFLQGIYLALCSGILVLATPIGGVLGDRYNKAKIMYICDLIKGAIILLSTLGIILMSERLTQLILLFAAGIAGEALGGVFSPSASALFPEILDDSQLQQANAYYSAKSALQSIIGVVLAGILYASLPANVLFFLVGACYILSGISEMFIQSKSIEKCDKLSASLMLSDMRDGLVYLKSQKALVALLTASLFLNFFINPIFSNFIPFFIKTDVDNSSDYLFHSLITPEFWSSVFNVILAVSMLGGSLLISSKDQEEKIGHKTAVWLCIASAVVIINAVGYAVLVAAGGSLNTYLILLCLCFSAFGFLIPSINIPSTTAVMRISDKDKLSKITSIITLLSMGLVPVSSLLAGAVLQYLGSTFLLLFCSAGMLFTALSLLLNRHVKEI